MSKFVDKLRSLSKSSSTPIGFHPSTSESRSSAMLLIVGLSGVAGEEAKKAADVNADAGLILDQVPSAGTVRQMVEAAGDVPLGVLAKGISEERTDELAGSGCDFVVFDIKVAAAILHKEEVGKFLMVEPSLDQSFVRAINSLEVDGVFISNRGIDYSQGSGATAPSATVAVEHLLICRRFVELLEKPVVLTLPSAVTRAEVTSLWQAGVDGVVTLTAQSGEALAELKKMIGALPTGARGRRARAGVMLPRYGGVVDVEDDEEEEEI